MTMRLARGLHDLFRRRLDEDDEYRRVFPRAIIAHEYRTRSAVHLDEEFKQVADSGLAQRFVELTATYTLRIPTTFPKRTRRGEPPTRKAVDAISGITPAAIIGEPGSGKTTCLLQVAQSELRRGDRLPVYVPLRGFMAENSGPLARMSLHPALFSQIRRALRPCGVDYHEGDRDLFLSELGRRPFLFLFDGLDEVDFESRFVAIHALQSWARYLNDHASAAARHHMVVATRKLNFNPADLGFETLELQEMDRDQITAFLRRYLTNRREVRKVLKHFDDHPPVRTIAQNPRWLFYITQVFNEQGTLPRSLGLLLDQVVDVFLAGWPAHAWGFTSSAAAIKRLLVPVGSKLQERGGSVIQYAEACSLVRDTVAAQGLLGLSEAPGTAIEEFEHRGILVIGKPTFPATPETTVRFRDKTVQEYFAALHVADEVAANGPPALDPYVADARWQEALALLPGILDTKDTQALAERLASRNVVLMGRVLGNSDDRDGQFATRMVAALTGPVERVVARMRWIGLIPPSAILACWALTLILLLVLTSFVSAAIVLGELSGTTLGGVIVLLVVPALVLAMLPHAITRVYWRFALDWQMRARESEVLPRILALRSIGSRAARRRLLELDQRITRQVYRACAFDDEEEGEDPLATLWRQLLEDFEAAQEVVATSPAQLVAAVRQGAGAALHLQQLLQVDLTDHPIQLVAELVKQHAPSSVDLLRTLDRFVLKAPLEARCAVTIRVFRSLLEDTGVTLASKRVVYRCLREAGDIPGWWVVDRTFIAQIAVPSFRVAFARLRRLWRQRGRHARRLMRVRRFRRRR